MLMQQGGEAATTTMSRNLSTPPRRTGPGMWVEQEKSVVVAEAVPLRETPPKHGSDQSMATSSVDRYDVAVRSAHSHTPIFEAM